MAKVAREADNLFAPTPMISLELELEIAEAEAKAREAQKESSPIHKVVLPPLYPLQAQIKREAARFNVICIGRRAGKTYLCTHLALETVLAGDPVGWFVPDYKIAAEVWREVDRLLKPVATKRNATERRIELENGGVLDVWTLENEDAGIGRKYKRVVIDEASKARNLEVAWQQSIRPTLTDLRGDAWFPSTPEGLNYFYQLFQRGLDPLQPEWKSWQLPSSVNPFLPEGEIEAARQDLPQLTFQQEYEAAFLTSDGAVFRNVDACCIHQPDSAAKHWGHIVVGGVDWGQRHDFTAISLYCVTCNREVLLDRFNQVGWGLQRGRLARHAREWKVRMLLIESNSIGSPNLEQMQRDIGDEVLVVGFEMTAATKPDLIQQMALSLEKRGSEWLDDKVAKLEMVAYEAIKTASGYTRYSAPDGGFDDTVIARCLALEAKKRNPIAVLSLREQVNLKMPIAWRDSYINRQDPVLAQRLRDARADDYEAALAMVRSTNQAHPDYTESDELTGEMENW